MLDAAQTLTDATALPWTETLAHGDVVSFRFPLEDADAAETPKARPCLVLDTQTIAGARYAVLAYGTSSQSRFNAGYEINLHDRAHHASAGLDEPTRFIGARRVMVPLTDPGFVICARTGAPILGRLSGAVLERMHAVRARLQAEADIAADRRQHRRRGRKRPAVRGFDFTVERRRPRVRRAERRA